MFEFQTPSGYSDLGWLFQNSLQSYKKMFEYQTLLQFFFKFSSFFHKNR